MSNESEDDELETDKIDISHEEMGLTPDDPEIEVIEPDLPGTSFHTKKAHESVREAYIVHLTRTCPYCDLEVETKQSSANGDKMAHTCTECNKSWQWSDNGLRGRLTE